MTLARDTGDFFILGLNFQVMLDGTQVYWCYT